MTLASYLSALMTVLCFTIASAKSTALASASSDLENIELVRYIDISTQLVIVNSHITVLNNGTDSVDSYIYFVDSQWAENLTFIEAFDDKKTRLAVERTPITEHTENVEMTYEIFLPKPLSSGQSSTFIVQMIITNYLISYPNTVKQGEKHMVKFPFNVYYYSMYFSHMQTTYLYIGTAKAATINGDDYSLANDTNYGLQYGPFVSVEPFKNSQSVFHYENNSPFLTVEKLKRFIKVSHWGFISVWDKISLLHTGPKLVGPFKRQYEIHRHRTTTDTSIDGYDTILPHYAFNIYMRDDIGLIWSYKTDYDDLNGVFVYITPRFTLYGGWKIEYEIGYSVPSRDYLKSDGFNEYLLSYPIADKIFANMVIKEAEINVILPEGAKFKYMDPYFDRENTSETKYCYYFDTICRDVITFKRYNLVERNIIDISIGYTFSKINMIAKPLTIAMYLYVIYILRKMILCSNSFFVINKKTDKVFKAVKFNDVPLSATIPTKKKNKKNQKQK